MGRPQKPSSAGAMGTLDMLILARLSRGSMHGFGIAEYLHQVSDSLHVDEGSLYPALHRLAGAVLQAHAAWTQAGGRRSLELAANGRCRQ
jgi:DNA-binding PadR family transcriptional regulator